MIFSILSAVLSLTPAHAADSPWSHRHLVSREGVSIDLDYQFEPNCIRQSDGGHTIALRLASPVWVNVDHLGAGSHVEIDTAFWQQELVRHSSNANGIYKDNQDYDRSLTLNESAPGRFTVNLGRVAVRRDDGAAESMIAIGQSLRIRVNGQSLIDPVSGADQFFVWLDDQRGCMNP